MENNFHRRRTSAQPGDNAGGLISVRALPPAPPACRYSLRRDSPNGPAVATASLGQTIYHRWECSDGGNNPPESNTPANSNKENGEATSTEPPVTSEGCSYRKLIYFELFFLY
jgi:hypothetical protein